MKHKEAYKQMHTETVYGVSSDQFLNKINKALPEDLVSILDYGCGQSTAVADIAKKRSIPCHQYDPCVKDKDTLPEKALDGFYCGDVLEHVPVKELPALFKELKGVSSRGLFVIATKEDRNILPDGSPAHCTVHDQSWWVQRLSKVFKVVKPLTNLQDSFRCWVYVETAAS